MPKPKRYAKCQYELHGPLAIHDSRSGNSLELATFRQGYQVCIDDLCHRQTTTAAKALNG